MTSRAPLAAVGAAALLAIVAACRQLVGIDDAPPTDLADASATKSDAGADAGPACGVAYTGAQCEACVETSCCAQATACANEPACNSLEGCFGMCSGDPTCRAKCVAEHRIGPDPFESPLAACLATNCSAPCGLKCGGIASAFGVDAAAGCQDCIVNKMCADTLACASQASCQAIAACNEANQFQDRQQACAAPYEDAGGDAIATVVSDLLTSCANDCAFGNQWFCLGTTLPAKENGSTTMSVALIDGISSAPIVDAAVAVCSPFSQTCDPLFTATPNDAGVVTLTIPPNSIATGPTGYLSIQGATLFPELFFWGFPISEPSVSFGVTIFTQSVVPLIVASVPVTVDLSRGVVIVDALDCFDEVSPGTHVSVEAGDAGDSQPSVFYFRGATISATAVDTDKTGVAAIVNVPVGPIVVTVTPEAIGKPSSVIQAFALAGTLTQIRAEVNQ